MVVVYLLLVPLSDCCQRLAADDGGDPEEDPLLGLPEGGGDAVPEDTMSVERIPVSEYN